MVKGLRGVRKKQQASIWGMLTGCQGRAYWAAGIYVPK